MTDMKALKVGDKAPEFKGLNEKGEPISLATYKGKKLILYFYPKDDTPGCTAEACNLRDEYADLKKMGFEVLGVSPDTSKKHGSFIEKYSLPFSLLADPEKETLNAYGVFGPKKFMGKDVIGVYRTTFIIDEKGKITNIISKVDTKNHAKQIFDLMA
jgi:thioredoxin-dependent peroxiredoxin